MSEPSERTEPGVEQPLAPIIEAILFVAAGPVSEQALAQATDSSTDAVSAALDALDATLAGRGVRLQRARDQVQLVSAPELAPWLERFLGLELSSRLSAAALETLAIIAYRQPITRPEIEAVRGVNSSGTLRTLIQRELVEEVGRLDTVGNPYQYATTSAFLNYFGLRSLGDLPPLEEGSQALIRARAEGG